MCAGEWQFASGADCSTLEEVQALLDESIKKSCEGLMVKTLHGPNAKYDIARRSHNWLKVRPIIIRLFKSLNPKSLMRS